MFLTIIATSFFIKWTFDHDGETITLGGDDPTSERHRPESSPTVESGDIDPDSGLPWVLEEELPVEGQGTLALIDQGGPFPFPDKDGSTFGNFEGLLPDHPGGYYAEYTVFTPGLDGPRRSAGSSPATAASSTGPRTTTHRSSGSRGGTHERTGQDSRPPPRARCLSLARGVRPPTRWRTRSSTPAGGSGTSTAGTHQTKPRVPDGGRRGARLPRPLRQQPRRPQRLPARPARPDRAAVGRLGPPGPRRRDRLRDGGHARWPRSCARLHGDAPLDRRCCAATGPRRRRAVRSTEAADSPAVRPPAG